MAQGSTLGPLQVVGNTPEEINLALHQILDQLDLLRGLRSAAHLVRRTDEGFDTMDGYQALQILREIGLIQNA